MKTRTITLKKPVYITHSSAVVGKKESEGPLKPYFDKIFMDTSCEQKSWELAESHLQSEAVRILLAKAKLIPDEIDCVFSGDLLNQNIGSTFGLMDYGIPVIGMYGACSTMSLAAANAAIHIESGTADRCIAVVSSHFCTAERQFRFPLEYGSVRPPTSQWTVTGSGAMLLEHSGNKCPKITRITFGKITELGIKDANNMGAAMAPAAADTLARFFHDTGAKPTDYDMILTGDLGQIGSTLLKSLMVKEFGIEISPMHADCGLMIYRREEQQVGAGGSGCGCSASVFNSYIMREFEKKRLNKILFMATGALLSTTSTQQRSTIPCIAHLLEIEQGE